MASELLRDCPAAVLVSSALLMRLEMEVLDAVRSLEEGGWGIEEVSLKMGLEIGFR